MEKINFALESRLIAEDDLSVGDKRLLECSKPLLVPMAVRMRFLISSADVLHS